MRTCHRLQYQNDRLKNADELRCCLPNAKSLRRHVNRIRDGTESQYWMYTRHLTVVAVDAVRFPRGVVRRVNSDR